VIARFTLHGVELGEVCLLEPLASAEVYKLKSMAWLPGTRVGSYEIVDVLGDGGMGKGVSRTAPDLKSHGGNESTSQIS
jgi:hypothetical protein